MPEEKMQEEVRRMNAILSSQCNLDGRRLVCALLPGLKVRTGYEQEI